MNKKYIKPAMKVKAIEAYNLMDNTSTTGLNQGGAQKPTDAGKSDGTPSVGAKSYNIWESDNE
jgi:hypothetical protein